MKPILRNRWITDASQQGTPTHQQLIVMPGDGVRPVAALSDDASAERPLKQFKLQSPEFQSPEFQSSELQSPELMESLPRAHLRGVRARAILSLLTSGGDRRNDETFAQLQNWGIEVAWTSEVFPVTHEQSLGRPPVPGLCPPHYIHD